MAQLRLRAKVLPATLLEPLPGGLFVDGCECPEALQGIQVQLQQVGAGLRQEAPGPGTFLPTDGAETFSGDARHPAVLQGLAQGQGAQMVGQGCLSQV